jgi:two-component system, cell cycle response regulator
MRVLVADGDSTSRLIVQTALQNLGHECETTNNGIQAWVAFLARRPDVVISDWRMRGMTGLELCRNIRSHGGRFAYFILASSPDEREKILEGMSEGADDYLVKPLDTDDLQVRLIAAARVTALHRQLSQQRHELEGLNRGLTAISLLDPLTNLGNRRSLQGDLQLLEAQVIRYGHGSCIALIGIDYFKGYNDTYGHVAGDEVLFTVASQLKHNARHGDAVYRYGGDEFICLFPEQSLETGAIAVQRMRLAIEQLGIPHDASPHGKVTMSAGLALLRTDHTSSASDVINEADGALYRAKELGRNRVEQAASVFPQADRPILGSVKKHATDAELRGHKRAG